MSHQIALKLPDAGPLISERNQSNLSLDVEVSMSKAWFRPKQYGYGFTPSSWEGVLAMIVYVVAVISICTLLPRQFSDHLMSMIITAVAVLLVTGAFLLVCTRTFEGDLRWR